MHGYRRITAKNLMNNERRHKILELIRRYPGIDLNGLTRYSGCNESTLRYHLELMEEEKVIRSSILGKSLHFFEKRARFSFNEERLLSYYSNASAGRILSLVYEHPGITRRDLAAFLGIASPTVTRMVQILVSEGCIRLQKDGKFTRHYLSDDSVTLIQRMIPA
jgi:predicted transcriptional regulator